MDHVNGEPDNGENEEEDQNYYGYYVVSLDHLGGVWCIEERRLIEGSVVFPGNEEVVESF